HITRNASRCRTVIPPFHGNAVNKKTLPARPLPAVTKIDALGIRIFPIFSPASPLARILGFFCWRSGGGPRPLGGGNQERGNKTRLSGSCFLRGPGHGNARQSTERAEAGR